MANKTLINLKISGPIDFIGDVHGCYDEMADLLDKLGYPVDRERFTATSPNGRTVVFLGDLCDRGPKNIDALRLAMNMVQSGIAYCILGNHDNALLRHMRGHDESAHFGLVETYEQLMEEEQGFIDEAEAFLNKLPYQYFLEDENMLIVHAGLPAEYQRNDSEEARTFCLAGNPTAELDENGSYVFVPWAEDYSGDPIVVYGHFVRPEIKFVNNTVCVDTGCVYGGWLSALRYPEMELVQVRPRKQYYKSAKYNFPIDTSTSDSST